MLTGFDRALFSVSRRCEVVAEYGRLWKGRLRYGGRLPWTPRTRL